jgi:UDP-N-acetylglucosamine--dolichyl-phosphate N-acetylglucosaminephosphotransferase
MVEIMLAALIFLVSLVLSFVLTDWWIKVAKRNKLVGKDMNKFNGGEVAEAGGIAAVSAIILGTLFYVFIKTFVIKSEASLPNVLVVLITLLLAVFIGFIDDVLGWKKGLKQWQKALMTLPIAIPLMVLNAGQHIMVIPLLGSIDFKWIYPILLVPIAMLGTTNGFNILAGYNGLEAGLGMIIFAFLGVASFVTGSTWLAVIAGIIVFSLLGFFVFNKYPAKVFPGDSLTYPLGAMIGVFAILGNNERVALFVFIPFIIEGILKLRSRLKAENFGIPKKDGSLDCRYEKNYSLTHVAIRVLKAIKGRATEKDVVYLILAFELILVVIALAWLI